MIIKILGSGCSKCKVMYTQVNKVLKELNITDVEVLKIENIEEIAKYNIMNTPALVIDESIKIIGRIGSTKEITKFIQDSYN